MEVPTEKRYEKYIEKALTQVVDDDLKYRSKIHKRDDIWYDKNHCIIEKEFLSFFKESQPETYKKIYSRYGESTAKKLISRFDNEINNKGLIHVLRKGFNDVYGGNIKLIYFKSNSLLNIKYRKEKYLKNRFLLVRQLHYSPNSNKSIDIAIFINGIPIITIELKNQLTGQNIDDSDHQYKFDRDPRGEPLLKFQRCICHFSVDNDVIHMTTRLNGEKTKFFPYNKTLNNLETISDGYKVDYLWREILIPTSILDIVENFVFFTYETESIWNDEKKMVIQEKTPLLIFPRYHQLDVIKKLREKVLKDGVGENYLIQHTTGSGKSYEIGWLSFMLINLFKNNGQDRIFDSIIIITDRKVLDKQLQRIVQKLENVRGIVQSINKDSEQLKKALADGKNIIITTIQKFSVVVKRIKELEGKSFAVIIDEVHSSQGGKGTVNLQKTLSFNQSENNSEEISEESNEILNLTKEMRSHQKQDHISFFGFTGTPKPQTLEVFGTSRDDGTKVPFHTYSMNQSIGEGFTLDVLQSFTTVSRYFKIKSKGKDIKIPEKKGKQALIKWVDSNPETISRKVSIILDHLLEITVNAINGRGKAMLIVRTIPDTLKFHTEVTKQLKNRGIDQKIKILLGFSGQTDFQGKEVSEREINSRNGFEGSDIPEGFKNPLFRLLIVCDKFQTGFNEPLLHTLFIDKPLKGVQCVQTLSRLNRKIKGKNNTFILDFVNKVDIVQKSFQDFYQTTILSEENDPNKIYDFLDLIRNFNIIYPEEIVEWSEIFFSKNRHDSQLQPLLNKAIERWQNLLDDNEKELAKTLIKNYCKGFSYISMINQFNNVEIYRYYLFFEYLKKKFPLDKNKKIDVSDLVDLDSLNLEVKGKININLKEEDTILNPSNNLGGSLKHEDELGLLSEIINEINEFYGKVPEGTEESSKKLIKDMINDEQFKTILLSENTESNKKDKLEKIYKEKNIKTLDISTKLFEIFNKKEMRDRVINALITNPQLIDSFS